MYAAKWAGRDRVYVYREADMAGELMDNQLTWKERLQRALEQDHFQLAFQPIVPVAGGAPSHFEVLVRMRGPDGRLHPPG